MFLYPLHRVQCVTEGQEHMPVFIPNPTGVGVFTSYMVLKV